MNRLRRWWRMLRNRCVVCIAPLEQDEKAVYYEFMCRSCHASKYHW